MVFRGYLGLWGGWSLLASRARRGIDPLRPKPEECPGEDSIEITHCHATKFSACRGKISIGSVGGLDLEFGP